MRLPLFIAYRYLFSKKKVNAINIITGIAMLGFGVGAFAMIAVLSTFNGLSEIVESTINSYDPDIKISAEGRKTFKYDESLFSIISETDNVLGVSQSLEEKVVIKYDNKQEIARIKGVGQAFDDQKFDSLIVIGDFNLGDSLRQYGVFGGGLASKLNLFPGAPDPVTVLVPRRDVEYNSLNPMASLSAKYLRPSGVFLVHEEIDNEVFLTSLDFTQELLSYPNEISAFEVYIQPDVNPFSVKEKLESALGPKFRVQTRRELNEVIYKIFSSEKWFTFAILALVLFISSFNIFGSLLMLVLDKKKDIGILKSMGAEEGTIYKIFLWQGCYIAMLGGGIGILLAAMLVLAQQYFGFITIDSSMVQEYPVKLLMKDVLLTFGTVSLLGYLISLYPSSKAAKTPISNIN